MIYDYALEPELVATWHDQRVAYPVLCQMGLGFKRVPCVFPTAGWSKLVVSALRRSIPEEQTPEWQNASKRIEILLRHLEQGGTRRPGKVSDPQGWLDAAKTEHATFPFGGILVRTSEIASSYVIAADRLNEFPAWTPPSPPTLRQSAELARALAPLLRCAGCVRFIDPYFDADVAAFLQPMQMYVEAMQLRRALGELKVEVHTWVRPDEVANAKSSFGGRPTEGDVAKSKVASTQARLAPLLRSAVSAHVFAWAQGKEGTRMHNRYVLTDVGGIALGTGLDADKTAAQSDDLTVLSKEQHSARWNEYSKAGPHRLVASATFKGNAR